MQTSISLTIPESIAFIRPLVARYNEIYRVEPIIGYFCLMLAVQQVLDSQWHTKEPVVAEFASYLMNTLEEMKNDKDLLDNEAAAAVLETDENSQEYVMRFANNIFDRAELATLTQKVTKQTAASFAAAAVFLGLDAVWNPLSGETQEKIKFSKFQAARILRAIKAGEDPNELYTIPDEADELSTGHGEAIDGETADDHEPVIAENDSPVELKKEDSSDTPEKEQSKSLSDRPSSPQVDTIETPSELNLPEAPKINPESYISLPQAPRSDPRNDVNLPNAPHAAPDMNSGETNSPPVQPAKPASPPKIPTKLPVQDAEPVKSTHSHEKPSSSLSSQQIMALTKSTGAAQKHAKYAISALNYDDVNTAISELEIALEVLKNLK